MDENIITVKNYIVCRLGSARPKTGTSLFLTERTGAQNHEKRSKFDKRYYSSAL